MENSLFLKLSVTITGLKMGGKAANGIRKIQKAWRTVAQAFQDFGSKTYRNERWLNTFAQYCEHTNVNLAHRFSF